MSDTKKPMVVWATRQTMDHLSLDDEKRKEFVAWMPLTGVVSTRKSNGDERPHLLLPIEDGALRVGEMLFCRGEDGHVVWQQPSVDAEDEWWCDGDDLLADLLMDAVEGVEP